MSQTFPGRYTAQTDKPLVLFLIGMRINKLVEFSKWWPFARAVPAMIKELKARPDSAFLWSQNFIGGRTTLMSQHWRSFDDTLAYAHDKKGTHFPAYGAIQQGGRQFRHGRLVA